MPHRLHLERFGAVHALPVLHYRMEFAHLVRQAINRLKPDCIAVELPPTLQERVIQAVRRLPQISVLSYSVDARHDRTIYLLIEPADPLVEAVRSALDYAIPVHFIDVDLDEYPVQAETLPDSYAVYRLGSADYFRAYRASAAHEQPHREDIRREQGMAYRLQRLAKTSARILFVGGMAHLDRIRQHYSRPLSEPLDRVRRDDVALHNLHPDSCVEVMGEFPFVSAIYETLRSGVPQEPATELPPLRRRYHALELIQGGKQDLPEAEILRAAIQAAAAHLGNADAMPDRQRILFRLFEAGARHYRQETGERLHHWQKRTFFRYCRNYALITGRLLPDLYQLLAAARGCLDDNFAFALWRLAGCYPWQREESELPLMRLTAEELFDQTRTIRFRPRKPTSKGTGGLGVVKKRRRERHAGEWLDGFGDGSICSWPPEDVVIENCGNVLKQRGLQQLSAERSRVEPLSSSLLDGIDLRETIRNLVHDGRIYVREQVRVKGGVDSVVIVFDEDQRQQQRYPFAMTWLGEHDQESDMAFYATDPAENICGPGICRCEYGGLLLSSPPRRMHDVWSDQTYRGLGSKGEVLLTAALDYAREPHVVYVAARPPRSMIKRLAARMGKRIVYLPLGSLSPGTLKRIRVMHLLYGHDKRGIAKDYIW